MRRIPLALAGHLAVAALFSTSLSAMAAEETRVVTGRVVDANGAAVPDVLVEWGRAFDGYSQREMVTTGEDGTYRLSTTRVGKDFRLGFSKDGLRSEWYDGFIPGPETRPITRNVTLAESEPIAIRFVSEGGKPVAGLKFSLATASNGFVSSFSHPTPSLPLPGKLREYATDENGEATLVGLPARPPKEMAANDWNWMQINIHAYKGAWYDQNITVAAVLGDPPVTIKLPDWQLPRSPQQDQGEVRGRVVDAATGAPITGYGMTFRHKAKVFVVGNADGRFALGGSLRVGDEYQLRVFAPGYAVATQMVRSTQRGGEGATAPLGNDATFKLERHPSFEGRVTNAASGKPLRGVEIVAGFAPAKGFKYMEWHNLGQYADGYHCLTNVLRVTTGEDGRLTIPEAAVEPVTLVVFHEGYERRILPPDQRAKAGEDGVVAVALQPEATITVATAKETSAGRTARSAKLLPALDDGFEQFAWSQKLDESGATTFRQLRAGQYRVLLDCDEQGHGSIATYEVKIALGPGEQEEVRLGAGVGPLRIFGKAHPFAQIGLNPEFDSELRSAGAVADADGQFEVTGLPAGKYALSVHDGSSLSGHIRRRKPHPLELTADQELDLSVAPWSDRPKFSPAE
jgi:uncharacterized protein (DUF2141 family)